MKKTSLYSQHTEHSEWIGKLAFYKDELAIMQNRIEEIISKNTSKEAAIDVEHFQNQIIIQTDTIKSLIRRIEKDEKAIQDNINKNSVACDHRKAEDHIEEREMIDSFEKNFREVKNELNRFLSKWM
jgi:hypothetical protein